ncbi:MAG: hypothetical protein E3J72_16295 [Planctomycetota bacterium]|nr:MAG: hypothetical protein E3J72_16295 [Planctomycetota bacterium]
MREPLLDGRFVVFFVIYSVVIAVAALIIFNRTTADDTGILSLAACYGTISCVRLAFALFGRLGFRASRNIICESVLLVLAGLPAGLVTAKAAGIAFSGIFAVELLVLGAFLLSGYVAILRERITFRIDLLYTGVAVACSFGMPFLWLQAALYARAEWEWLLGFSPFHHALAVNNPEWSSVVTYMIAFWLIAAGIAFALLARSVLKENAEINSGGEGIA